MSFVLMGAVLMQMSFVSATHSRCNTSGKEKVLLNGKKGCCPAIPREANTLDVRCCDFTEFETVFHNFKTEKSGSAFFQLVGLNVANNHTLSGFIQTPGSKTLWKHQKAPPLSARQMLQHICKYTI